MAPYLILDTYLEEAGAAADMVELVGDRPTHTVRPPFGDDVPRHAAEWRGLLLTGSAASATDRKIPWLEPLRALVRDAVAHEVPVFGICFGHQVIAQAVCGEAAVRRSPTPELGWSEIEVTAAHPLLEGVPRGFPFFVSHFDEVCVEDNTLDVFARTPRCAIHGFQVPGKPVYGLQFHPEMPPDECTRLVREGLPRIDPTADIEECLASARDGRDLGRRILANFFRLVGD